MPWILLVLLHGTESFLPATYPNAPGISSHANVVPCIEEKEFVRIVRIGCP